MSPVAPCIENETQRTTLPISSSCATPVCFGAPTRAVLPCTSAQYIKRTTLHSPEPPQLLSALRSPPLFQSSHGSVSQGSTRLSLSAHFFSLSLSLYVYGGMGFASLIAPYIQPCRTRSNIYPSSKPFHRKQGRFPRTAGHSPHPLHHWDSLKPLQLLRKLILKSCTPSPMDDTTGGTLFTSFPSHTVWNPICSSFFFFILHRFSP